MKMGVRDIARQLDRAPSTVTRKLKRNSLAYQTHDDSFAQGRAANELADARRLAAAKKKMRLKSYEIRHYVELHLREAHWTPQAIAGCLTRLGYNLSAQAIYDFIDCSSERGTVENRNKLLRRFFPKGEEIENYSDEFIQWVEDYVNSMPMAVLGFRTPDAVWNDPSFMRKAA
jgi:IS30 family transposase